VEAGITIVMSLVNMRLNYVSMHSFKPPPHTQAGVTLVMVTVFANKY